VAGSCERGNEHYGSIKGGKFLDQLSDFQLLKKDSAPCDRIIEACLLYHSCL
jgi:hypothetical protein